MLAKAAQCQAQGSSAAGEGEIAVSVMVSIEADKCLSDQINIGILGTLLRFGCG
jgi:hypothetical protein